VARRILVLHLAHEHIGHGLEAAALALTMRGDDFRDLTRKLSKVAQFAPYILISPALRERVPSLAAAERGG
jgi:hypothetical protein